MSGSRILDGFAIGTFSFQLGKKVPAHYDLTMTILLFGNEPYLLEEHLREMREKFFREHDPSKLNYSKVDGAGALPEVLEREFNSPPFLAKRRMVVVLGLLSKKIAEETEEVLAKVIKKIPESTIAIFMEGEKTSWKAAGLGKILSKGDYAKEHNAPKGAALEAWIMNMAAKYTLAIDRSARALLVASAIHGLHFLVNEIKKLAAAARHKDAKKSVTADALTVIPETTAFAFVDALLARNAKRAFEQFDMEALPLLAKQVGTIIKIKDWDERNKPAAELGKLLKLHPYVFLKNSQFARNYSLDALKKIHSGLLDLDVKLKRGAGSPNVLVSRFITSVTS